MVNNIRGVQAVLVFKPYARHRPKGYVIWFNPLGSGICPSSTWTAPNLFNHSVRRKCSWKVVLLSRLVRIKICCTRRWCTFLEEESHLSSQTFEILGAYGEVSLQASSSPRSSVISSVAYSGRWVTQYLSLTGRLCCFLTDSFPKMLLWTDQI